MSKLEAKKHRLEVVEREARSLERTLISNTNEQRRRMHALFAEAEELRIEIYSLWVGEY